MAEGDNYTDWMSVLFVGGANVGLSFATFGIGSGAVKGAGVGAKLLFKHLGKAVVRDAAIGALTDAGIETARQLVTGTGITNLEYDRIKEAGVMGGIIGGGSTLAGAALEGLAKTRVVKSAVAKVKGTLSKGAKVIKNEFVRLAMDNRGFLDLDAFKKSSVTESVEEIADGGSGPVKNWKGQEVKIPDGHIMSPRDPDFSEPPIYREGPYTDAQRAAFLSGTGGDTKIAPHHRHQIPVRDGGVIDEIPGPGHIEGNQHTAGTPTRHPSKSIFNSEPNGNKLRQDEVSEFWKSKGRRLIPNGKGGWIDPGY